MTERTCSECGAGLPSAHFKSCPGSCQRKRRNRLERERTAPPTKSTARKYAGVWRPDPNPPTDWKRVLSRAAASGGVEFAVKLAAELNKHRQRNGLPEVRV